MKTMLKKFALAATSAAVLGGVATSAHAANWLKLQGTEPADAAGRAKVWGFIQAQYQVDNSDPCTAGCNPPANNLTDVYIPPKLIGPNLTSQEQFNVNRARIGVRGVGLPLDNKVNYFILAEFGNNAITNANDGGTHLTDASITLNHLKYARIRAGLFKTPGYEEGMQAIHVFDYINFTTMGNQLMLERFPNSTYSANHPPVTLPVDTSDGGLNQFDQPVGAFRDVGIQVFDWFNVGNWEHSYAAMIGNGNGLNFGDVNSNKDKYLYWASELVFGGKGPRREGLKLFAWWQDGKRNLDNTDDGIYNPQEFDRKRQGVGLKYLKKPFRVTAEYAEGEGMIFVGPDKPTFDQNGPTTGNPFGDNVNQADGANGEADGWYLDLGWYVPTTKWELDLRYDYYKRLSTDPNVTAPVPPPLAGAVGKNFTSVWKTWTMGVQYHFNRKTRLTFNYSIRDVNSPAWGPSAGPNANMKGIGSIMGLQLTAIF
jgi:opacity protein-like surface antigen